MRLSLSSHKPEINRRRWERLPLAIPVFVRSSDDSGKEFLEFATAWNVSAGGALVAVKRSLRLSSQVLLEIPIAPVSAHPRQCKLSNSLLAKPVWVAHEEGHHIVGLKFLNPLLPGTSHRQNGKRKVASSE
ncbi:MAG: hypothetical protein JWO91_2297 [Acidobacteriaceae bacterium]|jgi:hypothetical protein|nr:hypothetical protein [Acidobacteriaceae bacterium]